MCQHARRLQSLESGERIARRDDSGERYFLDDTQREQEKLSKFANRFNQA